MKTHGIVTETDHTRLLNVVQSFRYENGVAAAIKALGETLMNSKRLPSTEVPPNVVTMNSVVFIKNLKNSEEMKVTLVYPKDVDIKERKFSVIAPIGVLLLGKKEGDTFEIKGPSIVSDYQIVKIEYQPERAGDLHL